MVYVTEISYNIVSIQTSLGGGYGFPHLSAGLKYLLSVTAPDLLAAAFDFRFYTAATFVGLTHLANVKIYLRRQSPASWAAKSCSTSGTW